MAYSETWTNTSCLELPGGVEAKLKDKETKLQCVGGTHAPQLSLAGVGALATESG